MVGCRRHGPWLVVGLGYAALQTVAAGAEQQLAGHGPPPLAAGLFALAIVFAWTQLARWAVGDRGAERGEAWALCGATVLGVALLKAPAGPTTALVRAFGGESLAGAVPPAAVHLATALLGSGVLVVAALVVLALRVARQRPRYLWPAWLACYGLLAAWTTQIQSLTGDEPHYLLGARSLACDGDADLGPDYAGGRYREFYPSDRLRRALGVQKELDPHDVPGPGGTRRPVHQLGYSVLLAPGYLLAGRLGAVAVAVLIASWLALVTGHLVAALWPTNEAGWPATAAVAFCSPLLVFSSSLHSEPAAALCLAWLALAAVRPAGSAPVAVASTLAALLLPWLHLKFVPVAAILAVAVLLRRRTVWPLVGLMVGVVSQLAGFAWMFGSWSPNAPQLCGGGKYPGAFSGSLWTGLPGLLFDQQDGLFVAWPLGLLAGPGLRRLWRRPGAGALLAAVLTHLLLIATYRLWRSGYAPAGRQLLPLVPLLAPFAVAGWQWAGTACPRALRLLVAVNAAGVALGCWLPRLRYPWEALDGLPRSPILAKLHLPWLDGLIPLTSQGLGPLLVAWAYLGVWLVVSARATNGTQSPAEEN